MIPETHDADLLPEGRKTTSVYSHGIGTQKGDKGNRH